MSAIHDRDVRRRFFLACLFATACAAETQERPRASSDTAGAPLTDVEIPPPPEEPESAPRVDRFATRRIGATTGARRFTGAPIDLDVKGADIDDVLRLLADVGRVNIVVAGEVSGTITLKLRRVPWDQVLAVVLETRGLAASREGNVIVVRAR